MAQPPATYLHAPMTAGGPVIIQQPKDTFPVIVVRISKRNGATQFILGVLAIVFQIAATTMDAEMGNIAAGIWAGFFFLAAGSFGLCIGIRKSLCKITFYGIFSFFASAAAIVMLVFSACGLQAELDNDDYCDEWDDYWCEYYYHNANVAMLIMLLILAVLEFFSAARAFVLCIRTCTSPHRDSDNRTVIQTPVSSGQQRVVYVPQVLPPGQYLTQHDGLWQPYPGTVVPQALPSYNEVATAPPAYSYAYTQGAADTPAAYTNATYSNEEEAASNVYNESHAQRMKYS